MQKKQNTEDFKKSQKQKEIELEQKIEQFLNWLYKDCKIIKSKDNVMIKTPKQINNWNEFKEINSNEDILELWYEYFQKEENLEKEFNDLVKKDILKEVSFLFEKPNLKPNHYINPKKEINKNIIFNSFSNQFVRTDLLNVVDDLSELKLEKFEQLKYYPSINFGADLTNLKVIDTSFLNNWFKEARTTFNNYNQMLGSANELDEQEFNQICEYEKVDMILYLLLMIISGNNLDNAKTILNFIKLGESDLKPDAKYLFLFGEGGNNKTLFLDILNHYYEDEKITILTEAFLDGNAFAAAEIVGKTVLVFDEFELKQSWFQKFKVMVSSTSTIYVDIKNKKPFVYQSPAKLITAGNELPCLDIVSREPYQRRTLFSKTLSKKEMQKLGIYNCFTEQLLNEVQTYIFEIAELLKKLTTLSLLESIKQHKNLKKCFQQTLKMLEDIDLSKKYLEYVEEQKHATNYKFLKYEDWLIEFSNPSKFKTFDEELENDDEELKEW